MENRKILNLEIILQVEKIKPGLAARILEIFLGSAPERYRVCRQGISSGDWHAVEYASHSLKSSAGQLGAEQLLDICGRMEEAAGNGSGAAVTAMADEFAKTYALTLTALEAEKTSWIAKAG